MSESTKDDMVERAARTMRNRFSMQTPPTEEDYTNARALARDGLLGDPELADWPRFAERDRQAALRTQAENERLVREREALQGQLELDSRRVYNAQVRAEKLSDTIDRVRTVLLDFGQLDKSNQTTALEALEKIDEIIDGEEDEDAPA